MMLLNYGVGEDSWESVGLQGDQTRGNQPWIFIGRTDAEVEAPILWPPDSKNWLIRKDSDVGKPWRQKEKRGWQRMRWMKSPSWWTWVWANSGSWWQTGEHGVLQSVGSQRIGHDWTTEQNWIDVLPLRQLH